MDSDIKHDDGYQHRVNAHALAKLDSIAFWVKFMGIVVLIGLLASIASVIWLGVQLTALPVQ